ncbi:hypothetical protein GCM10009612_76140 [Streptomyces beijiangensis]
MRVAVASAAQGKAARAPGVYRCDLIRKEEKPVVCAHLLSDAEMGPRGDGSDAGA